MTTLPEDMYDCLAATLFRETSVMHIQIAHFTHGASVYSSETRRKERRKNVLDIVRVRQTCKAMLAAVRALEEGEYRSAVDVFWKSTLSGPLGFFCAGARPWVRESHVQLLEYEGKDVLKLFTKRQSRMLKMLITEGKTYPACPRKIIFRIEGVSDVEDGCSGSDSDEEILHTEVSLKESELVEAVKTWLREQRKCVRV
jgi:hypothetical protein